MRLMLNNSSITTIHVPPNAGSVGGFFTFGQDDDVYGITNFHVIQDNGHGVTNAPVFEIGRKGEIGNLEYWYELVGGLNYFDLALFRINLNTVRPKWNIPVEGYADSTIVRTVELHKGNSVRHGICNGIEEGPFNLTINETTFQFTNLLRIRSVVSDSPFSNRGDSGSIIMSDNRIVALLLGADPNDYTVSYGIPFIDGRKQKGILNFLNLRPYKPD